MWFVVAQCSAHMRSTLVVTSHRWKWGVISNGICSYSKEMSSRKPLYPRLLVVNNMVLLPKHLKKANLMLSVLTTKTNKQTKIRGGHEDTFEDDGYAYYVDCRHDFPGVCLFSSSPRFRL